MHIETVNTLQQAYGIVQNDGGGKFWRIDRFRVLARKTLANLIF